MSKTRADIQKKALDILVGGDVGASMGDEDALRSMATLTARLPS
jgi:hypothetical protein